MTDTGSPSLERYRREWRLVPDGEAFRSLSSDLLFVRDEGCPAVLKVPFDPEERFGGILMHWWDGTGAARLFRLDRGSGAMVLERAVGDRDLAAMARVGQDEEVLKILVDAAMALHSPRRAPPPDGLVGLREWFAALPVAARNRGGVFASAMEVADGLLRSECDRFVLHGDLHHGNVLDFGPRGWLAIDPKHIFGERTFDYVNMLRNPDWETPPEPDRYRRHVEIVASRAGLDRDRLLRWSFAFAGLSAAWIADDGDHPAGDLAVAELTGAMLGLA